MSQITLNLDTDALREATAQAIIGVLTPEIKEQVLNNAIQAVLQPSTDSWNKNKSPLQMAFDNAIRDIAIVEANRLVQEDEEIKNKIKSLLRDTADRVLNTDQEKLAERMADAFVNSMRRD